MLIKKIVDNSFESRKGAFKQFIEDDWMEDIFVYYYVAPMKYPTEEKELINKLNEVINKDFWWSLLPSFSKMLINHQELLVYNEKLNNEIENFDEEEKKCIGDILQERIRLIKKGKADLDSVDSCKYFIITYYNVFDKYLRTYNDQKDLKGDIYIPLRKLMCEGKTERVKKLHEWLEHILRSKYNELYYYYLRLYACIKNVKSWEPDLVIFDEFQNYPQLFNQESENDIRTDNIKKILDAVSENAKILMLSATPYSYHNMIASGADECGEEVFLNHIGMEDILAYMEKQNGIKVNHSELFKDYHKKIEEFQDYFSSENEDGKNSIYQALCEKAQEISDALYNAGISRNERPAINFDLKGEKLYVSPEQVVKQSTDIYSYVSGKNNDPAMARRFLSIPVYVSGKKDSKDDKTNEEEINKDLCQGVLSLSEAKEEASNKGMDFLYRVRVTELLKDIFPEDDDFIPPIFMPPIISEELEGPFKYLAEKNYAKMILFSAYTSVPKLLTEVVNERFMHCIEDIERVQTDGDTAVFDDYLDGILCSTDYKIIFNKELVKEELRRKFSNDISSKIIRKAITKFSKDEYKKVTKDNYWERVTEYCKWGKFDAVLEEFIFLLEKEKENDANFTLEKYLGKDVETCQYAVSYTSKNLKGQNALIQKIDMFQSPFYPFCFFLSSVAQEGLDFHWYCDRIVHWNVPASPIAMLQREGRINRYRCYSLRRQLKKDLEEKYDDEYKKQVHNMKELFVFAAKKSDDFSGARGFYPDHLSLKNEALPITRKCYYYPLSEEYFRWKDLLVNMEFYRSLFGAWESSDRISEEMLEYIREMEKCGEGSVMIDISPISKKAEQKEETP